MSGDLILELGIFIGWMVIERGSDGYCVGDDWEVGAKRLSNIL